MPTKQGTGIMTKYYHTKQFIKLQNKWYDKLRKSGYDDIEFLNKQTGRGQDSPYLSSTKNRSTYKIRKKYSSASSAYYRLSSIFLAHGEFCRQKPRKNAAKALKTSLSYLKFNNLDQSLEILRDTHYPKAPKNHLYTYAEYLIWQMICEAKSYRYISGKLRKLYKAGKVDQDLEVTVKNPWSIYTIHKRVLFMQDQMREFFKANPLEQHVQATQDPLDILIERELGRDIEDLGTSLEGLDTPLGCDIEDLGTSLQGLGTPFECDINDLEDIKDLGTPSIGKKGESW